MKIVRTISAYLLALLVLMSSTSFMVGLHFCGGDVQHIALFSKAEKCAMEKVVPPCHKHLQEPCCADETIIHEGDDFKASVAKIHVAAPDFSVVEHFPVVIAEVIPDSPVSRITFEAYDPPLRSYDRIVDLQVFLI